MAQLLTLTRLAFKVGSAPVDPPLDFSPPTVTVLVGPNGSGKSLALAEIDAWAEGSRVNRLVVDQLEARWPTYDEARELLEPHEIRGLELGQNLPSPGSFRVLAPGVLGGHGQDIHEQQLRDSLDPANSLHPSYSSLRGQLLFKFFKVRLTGRDRHALANDQGLGDLKRPQTHLAVLFANDGLRAKVRGLVYAAFAMYFTLDPTSSGGNIRVRLNAREPASPELERSLSDEAIEYHSRGLLLTEQSDGVQAYTGLVAGLYALPHRLILVDEPEAFLPPPIARRLGAALGSLGRDRGATIVAATHSAPFLIGCIASGADTTIVRLTFDRATTAATARQLPQSELQPLMAEPLLRSSRALEGLFHRAVVVTEGDADRAFYDEINSRLNESGRGVADAQFINAQNWQTEARIVAPLRRLGVPTAAILDIDALWNPLADWKPLYRAAGLDASTPTFATLEAQRRACIGQAADRAIAKSGGVAAIHSSRRAQLRKHVADLASLGIFIVPVGELEQWLPQLAVPRGKGKHQWIVKMLLRLGSNPQAPNYVSPGLGDVWRFLDTIEKWVVDPNRAGMP